MIRLVALLLISLTMPAAEPVTRKTMSLALARELTMAAEAEARKNNWNVIIVIADETGHLVTLTRMDDTQYGSLDVAQRKAATAAQFRRSTRVFADRVLKGDQTPLSVPGIIAIPGGLPFTLDGKVIGSIGVSGVTSDQDEQIANAAVAAFQKR